jgi:hypothetical protein
MPRLAGLLMVCALSVLAACESNPIVIKHVHVITFDFEKAIQAPKAVPKN